MVLLFDGFTKLLLLGINTMKTINKDKDKDKDAKKAAMKELRSQRKNLIAAASSTMKQQKKDMAAIKAFFKDSGCNHPGNCSGD